jgi:hypothetical protein
MAKTYKDDGIDWKANSDAINTRKNSSNIELTELAATNPMIFIDPVTVKFDVVDFINVINTRFSYFKFPVQTAGTSDLSDINIDLGFEVDNSLFVQNQINRTYILSTVGSQQIPEINIKQYTNSDGTEWPGSENIVDLAKANKLLLQLEAGSDPVDIFSVTDPLIKTLDEYDKLQASDGVINTFKFDVSVTYVPNKTLNTQTSTAYFLRLLHTPFSNGDTTLGATTAAAYTPSSYPWIVALDKQFDISSQAQDNYDRRIEKVNEELRRDDRDRKVELKKDPRNMLLTYLEYIIPLERILLTTDRNGKTSYNSPDVESGDGYGLAGEYYYNKSLPVSIPGGDINQTIFRDGGDWWTEYEAYSPGQGPTYRYKSLAGSLWTPLNRKNTAATRIWGQNFAQLLTYTWQLRELLECFYDLEEQEYVYNTKYKNGKQFRYPTKLRSDYKTNPHIGVAYSFYDALINKNDLQNNARISVGTLTEDSGPIENVNQLEDELSNIRRQFDNEWNAYYWSVTKNLKLKNGIPVTTSDQFEQYLIEKYEAYAPTEFVSRLNNFKPSQSQDGSMNIQFEYAVPYGLLKHIREYIKNGNSKINFYLQAYSTFPAEVKDVNWKISIYSVPKASNSLTKDYKTNPHILNISNRPTYYYGASTIPVDTNDIMRVPDRFTGLLNVSDNCQLLLQYNPWDNVSSNYVSDPTGVPVATKHGNTFTALPVNIATVSNHIEMQVDGKSITSDLLNSWGFDRQYDLILGKV